MFSSDQTRDHDDISVSRRFPGGSRDNVGSRHLMVTSAYLSDSRSAGPPRRKLVSLDE